MNDPEILIWTDAEPDSALLDRAIAALQQGQLVVAPTETRYGLLARADSEAALLRLYEAKGRPPTMPVAMFVRDEATVLSLAHVSAPARKLMSDFLPGPLTLVLPARVAWGPPRVVDGKIGFRWSSSVLIDALVRGVPFSLTATSANLSGRPEMETVDQIVRQFGSSVAVCIDGGRLAGPVSTVVECSSEGIKIRRVGAIATEAVFDSIRDIAGND